MSFRRIRKRVKVAPLGASLTEQHFRDRQDVNAIVARCLRGDMSGLKTCGVNADISDVATDLQTMLNNRIAAERVFDALPDEVKSRFRTPSDFVAACNSDEHRSTFEELGLLRRVEKVQPVKVEITNPKPVTPEGGAG